ncbi:hypothetical protein N8I77_007281 [Diaporthe amygdali]|uniref:Peptidase A1 domain-containing protein n=1 Tax=Phomopsis amygdali TaxID=1214568 RepID=A0AAD9SBQ3_PHOAM|nr:hypothetical protein N8I77_007281 [Diaporthe amygdali]
MATKWKRTPRVSAEFLPKASLPEQKIPRDVDADTVLISCVEKLRSLKAKDLHVKSYWRDLFALTNTFRTFSLSEQIIPAWTDLSATHKPSEFKYVKGSAHLAPPGPAALFIAGRFTFKIGGELPGVGSGSIAVVADGDEWKIWFFNTVLEVIDTFGNPDLVPRAPKTSMSNGVTNETGDKPVDCVVIGAGQSGLGVLGRLKALGVKGVALERNDTIGGNWTGRYDNVKLHTSKYYAALPGDKTFHDDGLPYLLGSKELAEGFQRYANEFDLDVRVSTTVESAKWNEGTKVWTVEAKQNGRDWSIQGRHLVFAIGAVGQFPKIPQIPNREAFQGTAMHSVQYKYPTAWKGKKGVVVGTANTAHDVAEDMVDAELSSVTLVQRSPTAILPYKYFKTLHQPRYNKDSNIEESDRAEWGMPAPILRVVSSMIFKKLYSQDPEPFDGLNKVGFRAELPNILKIHERSGGHYLDVGCSQKIIDGKVKVKGGEIESFTPTGLKFTDGTTLDSDLIVFATGFNTNIREEMEKIVGPEVGNLLEDNNGWDKEGETRGAWKRHGHPAIWHTSGDLGMSRLFSRFLAFQIKADLEGLPFEPYTKIIQSIVITMTVISLAQSATFLATVLLSSVQAAPSPTLAFKSREGGVGVLDITIPPNRKDDRYYTVDVDFEGQSLPVLLDTGSADLFVASTQCPTTDESSGCLGLTEQFIIDNNTRIVTNETFYTIVGEGPVSGNQSLLDVGLGGIVADDFATGLIYAAVRNEFQGGSFAGLIGLSMTAVSRQTYFNHRPPLFDALVAGGIVKKPLFSISLPRLGDPDSKPVGKLTLGDIEPEYAGLNITYSDIINSTNYNYDDFPLQAQGWAIELQGLRVNGVAVNLTRGLLDEGGRYMSLLDTGGSDILVRYDELTAIAKLFKGPVIFENEHDIYYDCSIPQLLELKYNDQWFPVDPLDILNPNDHGNINGTEMCKAQISSWSRVFADSIIGVPFLRSAFSVFDYVTPNLYSVQPRVGLAPLVDGQAAVTRYPQLYKNRLL